MKDDERKILMPSIMEPKHDADADYERFLQLHRALDEAEDRSTVRGRFLSKISSMHESVT